MISFKQFLNEALSVSNTHYKKYFDLVQSYVGANKRKEVVNGNEIKITFLNGSKEIITLNYEGDGRKLELKSFIKDNKETNIDKEIRDTKSIRDLIGTPLDFYFSNDKSNDSKTKKYKPKNRDELKELCDDLSIHLGDIDTSLITDMSGLFKNNGRLNDTFKGIETWDTSRVTDMCEMFCNCNNFNQNISNWNTSKVTNMSFMFKSCYSFNQLLNNWNVSNVKNMNSMFSDCRKFNQPLNKWNTSRVTDMHNMFINCSEYNQPLNNWNVDKVIDLSFAFHNCPIKDEYKPKFN